MKTKKPGELNLSWNQLQSITLQVQNANFLTENENFETHNKKTQMTIVSISITTQD